MAGVILTSQGKALMKDSKIVGLDLQYVDYLWADVGNPRIEVTFASSRTRIYSTIRFHDTIPNDNNAFIRLFDSSGNGTASYIDNKIFRMWHGRGQRSYTTNVTAQINHDYTVILTPNTNLTGYLMGVDNTWSSGAPIDYYVKLYIARSGTAVIPVAYGTISLFDRTGTSGGTAVYADIAKLRPCRYNGEYGMWDMLSNTFYGNVVDGASWTGGSLNS